MTGVVGAPEIDDDRFTPNPSPPAFAPRATARRALPKARAER